MFGLLSWIPRVLKFFRVWGKLLIVVGPAIAGFIWSPFFRTFFLGIAVGASLLFALQYSEFFTAPIRDCFNPKVDPNGASCKQWVSTDKDRGYGYWKTCDGLQ
jgi:hypothetical protein